MRKGDAILQVNRDEGCAAPKKLADMAEAILGAVAVWQTLGKIWSALADFSE